MNKEPRILCYHGISNSEYDVPIFPKKHFFNTINKTTFRKQLKYLLKYYKIVSLSDIINFSVDNCVAVLTFDDGYKSVLEFFHNEDTGIPFTLFLNSYSYESEKGIPLHIYYYAKNKGKEIDELNYGLLNDRYATYRKIWEEFTEYEKREVMNFYLNKSELETIKCNKNITVGGHGRGHFRLSSLTYNEQFEEIKSNKVYLEKIFDKNIDFFAYPFGKRSDYNENSIEILNMCGYTHAFGAVIGQGESSANYEIPRVNGLEQPIWYFTCEIEQVINRVKKCLKQKYCK